MRSAKNFVICLLLAIPLGAASAARARAQDAVEATRDAEQRAGDAAERPSDQAERERASRQERQQRERAAFEERQTHERAAAEERQARQREAAEARDNRDRELERAREDLERAARDVARLAQEFAAPYAVELRRQLQGLNGRAVLGVTPEDAERGVRVAGVTPNGAAAEAGLQLGDVIVEIDGAALVGPEAADSPDRQSPSDVLIAQMGNVKPGEEIVLRIDRNGAERDVTLRTRERGGFDFGFGFDEPRKGTAPQSFRRMFFGGNPWEDMQLVTLTPELGSYFGTDAGLLVVRAPADEALGLRDGDVILDIGGRVPSSPEHAIRILATFEASEALHVNIMRRQRRESLEIVVPGE